MKKLFSLYFIFLSCILFAQQYPSSGCLTIFSDNSEMFSVYLNGELQNIQPRSNVTIKNLNQRFYNVKISFENTALKNITKNYVTVMGKDGKTFEDATYKIKIDYKTKKTKLNYYSGKDIVPDFYPNQDSLEANQNPSPNQNVTINNGINISINGKEQSRSNLDYKNRKCPEMSPAEFEIAMASIKKENFDDQKSAIAQNIILNNCLKTNQIAQIAKTFSFADNQMKFAKQAYNSCVDVRNYYLIKDVFSFQVDQQEFMNFINSNK
ncbi:DUF4476 domain-containing protein [Flavobacterium sp. KACC 22761]|uniref:DUF4476 domain-containing protein n=1 Tax=Flavobacterium sp. KACC 22761 TaxID=3092665 RepID=UPI002A75E282|nr:DUF4476 domain-containing protein [Flavobacterium sp. KACC 22761]WPO80832.1 DUF4476 domain-containing protein [Flavobacterium sp. KACC 22761]